MTEFTKEDMEVAATSKWKAKMQQLVNEVQPRELWDIDGAGVIFDEEYGGSKEEELQMEYLILAPAQMKDRQPETDVL